jgi:hypothetical protein
MGVARAGAVVITVIIEGIMAPIITVIMEAILISTVIPMVTGIHIRDTTAGTATEAIRAGMAVEDTDIIVAATDMFGETMAIIPMAGAMVRDSVVAALAAVCMQVGEDTVAIAERALHPFLSACAV